MDSQRQKHILVLEDEEALGRLLKSQLEATGFDVHTETHGRAALAYAAEHRLDLAILDVNLPDLNGYHVARELRKLYHPWVVPIVMLTINDKPMDQLRGFAHGADAYLTKPFQVNELFEVVGMLAGSSSAPPRPGDSLA